MKKIRNLDLILSITIGFLALFSNQKKTKLRVFVKKVSERIFDIPNFEYYALADGIKEILAKSYTGIASFCKSYYKKRRSQKILRLSLPL